MNATDVVRYLKSPEVPLWRKGLIFAAGLYLVMPIDIIPDVLPVVGWLDDLGFLGLAMTVMVRDIRRVAAGPAIEGEVVESKSTRPQRVVEEKT